MLDLLRSNRPESGSGAAEILKRVDLAPHVQELRALLMRCQDDRLAATLAIAIGQQSAEVLATLLQGLESFPRSVKRAVLNELRYRPLAKDLPSVLVPLVEDPDPEIAAAAGALLHPESRQPRMPRDE